MAVTVTWYEWNGTDDPDVDAGTLITALVVGSTDGYDFVPADYPIDVGDNSYSKHLKVRFTDTGSGDVIGDAKIHKSSGVYKTDEVLKYDKDHVKGATPPSASDIGGVTIPVSEPASQNLDLPDSGNVLEGDGYSEQFAIQLQTSVVTDEGAFNQKTLTLTYDVS